jgi:hypothetical protein
MAFASTITGLARASVSQLMNAANGSAGKVSNPASPYERRMAEISALVNELSIAVSNVTFAK